MINEGKYLYCIIEESQNRNFGRIGIGNRDDEVYTIGFRDLACVVSSTPMTKYVINRQNLMAHEKVIEKVMEDYTVLPVRFCTIATSVEEVRNLLSRRYQEFKNLLRSVDNKVELGLKVLWRNMAAIFDEISVRSRKIRKLRTRLEVKGKPPTFEEGSNIGKEVKKLLDRKREEESEEIIDRLKPLCTGLKINDIAGDSVVLNAAFLVDRMRELEFDDQIDRLSQRCADRFRFKYVGPTPPFNFIELVVHWGQEE